MHTSTDIAALLLNAGASVRTLQLTWEYHYDSSIMQAIIDRSPFDFGTLEPSAFSVHHSVIWDKMIGWRFAVCSSGCVTNVRRGDLWWQKSDHDNVLQTNDRKVLQHATAKGQTGSFSQVDGTGYSIHRVALLNPAFLVTYYTLEVIHQMTMLNRNAVLLRAELNEKVNNDIDDPFWLGADYYEIPVDLLSGYLLGYTAWINSKQLSVEATSVVFNEQIVSTTFDP